MIEAYTVTVLARYITVIAKSRVPASTCAVVAVLLIDQHDTGSCCCVCGLI